MRIFGTLIAAIALLTVAANVFAAQSTNDKLMPSKNAASVYSIFEPRPTKNTKLDFDNWDALLESMVLYTGPSTRTIKSRPAPETGSRFVKAHTSKLRMEGNKIPFSLFKREFLEFLTEYRSDLEKVGNDYDIAAMSKNTQLAYWLNLHNVTLIEQIAKEYPVKTPNTLRVGPDGEILHESKLLTIRGVPLSLRDIRENIVYPNWNDPIVAYGFFMGDLGSPSISNYAFTAENINWVLEQNAREFVNSLRGFQHRRGKVYVSKMYRELRSIYFPDFERDLTTHFGKYMDAELLNLYGRPSDIRFLNYDLTIADLTAGYGKKFSASQVIRDGSAFGSVAVNTYIRDLDEKRKLLIKQGKLSKSGRVIIEDIATEDPDLQEVE